jgi:hypothetical protein
MPHPVPVHAHDLPHSSFEEFRLCERDTRNVAQDADERLATARLLLRATWPVSTDTFVTGDLPLLLTRAAQIDTPR